MNNDPAQRLVAHRGYRRRYPENTLLAHQQAIAAGARYIETDILLSADLQPVLYHDDTLNRVSGRRGRIFDFSLEQLKKIPAHEPARLGERFQDERIAPLSALVTLLEAAPEITAFIEIKEEAVAFAGKERCYAAVAAVLEPVANQCVMISFDFEFMLYARRQGWQRCGVVLNHWRDLEQPGVIATKPEVIFCNWRKIPRNANFDSIPGQLVVYEIARANHARKWLQRGAGMVETFDIGNMLKKLT